MLNENHQRSLVAAFRHIEDLLSDVETAAAASSSPFARHFADLSPTEKRVIADFLARIREQMAQALAALAILSRRPSRSPRLRSRRAPPRA